MIPQYLEPLVHHLWQSTLFAAVIGAATLAMSKNRATVRHKLWLAASLKFLIPFSLFVSFGNQFEWRTIPAAPETSGLVVAAEWLTAESPLPTSSVSESRLPAILSGLWLCGFAACVLPWLLRSRRIRATLRQASPLPLELPIKAVSYPGRLVPGVFGILKPVLLLPEGITDRLTREQLHSVLTHELCHVRRRDNLWSMVHLLVESLFWFHPLVWWLETKLVEEQERACDEEVLRLGSDPEVYARGIIKVCEHYLTAGIVYGARVSGSDLTKRIEAIMANNTAENLDRGRQLLVAVVAVAAVLAPFGFGVLTAPPIRAELPIEAALLISEATYVEEPLLKVTPSTVARPPRTIASRRESQDARPSVPLFAAFDEITITLNTSGDEPAWHFEAQRVALTSVTVRDVLLSAYGMEAAKDHFISELPAWAETERFDINAKASRPITSQTERNLMIMSILTDRFHLKLRGVTREMPVYALVVPEPSELEIMESIARRVEYGNNRSNLVEVGPTSPGGPIPGLVSFLQRRLDLPVVDRTGLKGRYRYRLEWDADRSSIFAAVEEQLGLKLEKQTGPVQMIVIDQLEKPTVH